MNKKIENLHIIIYSDLSAAGGGRETWLSYFLPSIVASKKFKKIYIYCLSSKQIGSENLQNKFSEFDNVKFSPCKINNISKRSAIKNAIDFTYNVLNNFRKNYSKNDLVLSLGATMEGISTLLLNRLYKDKIIIFTWMRSIGTKEISSRTRKVALDIAEKIEKKVFELSENIIMNGNDTYNYYANKYKYSINKFTTIHNAVEVEKFSLIKYPEFKNRITIAYIGRFNKEKGFYDYLQSIKMFNSKNPSNNRVDFELWGHGQNFDQTEINNLYYGGILSRKEIISKLETIDALVFLNQSNLGLAAGLSHGLLEAMSSGRLCIAYDNPAHNQVLNSENSILLEENNLQKLVEVYESLERVNNNNLCRNARITAKNFSVERHIQKFMHLVELLEINKVKI